MSDIQLYSTPEFPRIKASPTNSSWGGSPNGLLGLYSTINVGDVGSPPISASVDVVVVVGEAAATLSVDWVVVVAAAATAAVAAAAWWWLWWCLEVGKG